MKTLIIFVLTIALIAAAFFTRPSQASFKQKVAADMTQGDSNALKSSWDQFQAEQFANGCEYKDRFLWVDVKKDGKTLYTGAFAHWFNHGKIETGLDKAKHEINSIHIEKK
jgi:hypothetical protein